MTCDCARQHERVEVLGVPIDALKVADLPAAYGRFIDCGQTHVVHHLAADPLVVSLDSPEFRMALTEADLNLPDGMGVVWAAKSLGSRTIAERTYGPDGMLEVIASGIEHRISHAFLGGTDATLQALKNNLRRSFPDVRIVGSYAPPMGAISGASVDEDLRNLGVQADVLWVGLGTPKQQLWATLARDSRPAKVIVTVGAAFDFHAGVKSQAPSWIQRSGLEWAYRLASEPSRLWRRYLLGNPRFVRAVMAQRRAERRAGG